MTREGTFAGTGIDGARSVIAHTATAASGAAMAQKWSGSARWTGPGCGRG